MHRLAELRQKLEWKNIDSSSISQVYQNGLEFSLLSIDGKQILPWVHCKDFLHDTIFAAVNLEHISIFGIEYDPKKEPLPSFRRLRLLVTNRSDPDFAAKIPNAVDLIHQVEDDLKIPGQTRVFKCPDPPKKFQKCGVWLFSAHRHWLHAPPLLSMYTLFLRIGLVHELGKSYKSTLEQIANGKRAAYQQKGFSLNSLDLVAGSDDRIQLKSALPALEKLLKEGYKNVFSNDMKKNYPSGLTSGVVHGSFGICAFTNRFPIQYVPDWYKK